MPEVSVKILAQIEDSAPIHIATAVGGSAAELVDLVHEMLLPLEKLSEADGIVKTPVEGDWLRV